MPFFSGRDFELKPPTIGSCPTACWAPERAGSPGSYRQLPRRGSDETAQHRLGRISHQHQLRKARHEQEVLTSLASKRHQQARVCGGTDISGYDRYTVQITTCTWRTMKRRQKDRQRRMPERAGLECLGADRQKKNETTGRRLDPFAVGSADLEGVGHFPCAPGPSPVVSTRNTAGGNTTAHIDGGARGDTIARVLGVLGRVHLSCATSSTLPIPTIIVLCARTGSLPASLPPT